MSTSKLTKVLKARGNWGHGGRPGKVGGSTPGSSMSESVPMTPQLEAFENEMWNNMPQRVGTDLLLDMKPIRGDWKRMSSGIIYHSTNHPDVDAVVDEQEGKLVGVVGTFDADLGAGQKPIVAMTPVGTTTYFDDSLDAMKHLVKVSN